MRSTTLVVPGLHGSGPGHWQTWIESQIADAVRVEQTDWDKPMLSRWAGAVVQAIDRAKGGVFLVAHSFGSLAAVVAAYRRVDRIAGALLVAPADPARFSATGLRDSFAEKAVELPRRPLGIPSIVVASGNDPWTKLTTAAFWADRWGGRLIALEGVGHINVDSGHGPWPLGLELYRSLRAAQHQDPLGSLTAEPMSA
jgi:predicted alpha/beta hydrolase family esterase